MWSSSKQDGHDQCLPEVTTQLPILPQVRPPWAVGHYQHLANSQSRTLQYAWHTHSGDAYPHQNVVPLCCETINTSLPAHTSIDSWLSLAVPGSQDISLRSVCMHTFSRAAAGDLQCTTTLAALLQRLHCHKVTVTPDANHLYKSHLTRLRAGERHAQWRLNLAN